MALPNTQQVKLSWTVVPACVCAGGSQRGQLSALIGTSAFLLLNSCEIQS